MSSSKTSSSNIFRKEIPPYYQISGKDGKKNKGVYNAYVICVVLIFLCYYFEIRYASQPRHLVYPNVFFVKGTVRSVLLSVSKEFVWLMVVSLVMAMLLDRPKDFSANLSLKVLPLQLKSYGILLFYVIQDVYVQWIGSFALYVLFHKILATMVVPEMKHGIGYPLFMMYFVSRTIFIVAAYFKKEISPDVPRRRMLWAYFTGFVGLAVRSYRLNVMEVMADKVYEDFNLHSMALEPTWLNYGVFCVVGSCWSFYVILLSGNSIGTDYLYYKLHRTFHRVPQLWAFCHAVHHKAITPCLLDSGTIGPPELVLTETAIPAMILWPHPVQLVWESFHMILHYMGHDATQDNGIHHVMHHKLLNCNYGIYDHFDIYFKTVHTAPLLKED